MDGDASATSTKYLFIQLDQPLKADDQIAISQYCTSDPSKKNFGASIYATRDGQALASNHNTAKNKEEELMTNVPEALVGKQEFYIFRNPSLSVFITGVKVIRKVATGINAISESAANSTAVYDAFGRKVCVLKAGQLYIINGKKFIFNK